MKKLICFLLTLMLLIALSVSVGAAYIMDDADLLDAGEWEYLEGEAQRISETYDFGVYAITVDDFTDYGKTDVFDAATSFYEELQLKENGLLLLLSMEDRDYSLITHGDFGNYAFNDEGREAMTEFFLDDFAADGWYYGLFDYVDFAEDYLETAKNGAPYTAENPPVDSLAAAVDVGVDVGLALVIPFAIAGIVIAICNAKMRSVAPATHASAYVTGDLIMEKSLDNYLHTTTTRVKRQTNTTTSSGGGGSRTSRSGGFSGTSGKF